MPTFVKWSRLISIVIFIGILSFAVYSKDIAANDLSQAATLSATEVSTPDGTVSPMPDSTSEVRPELEQYFKEFNVVGSFELYDLNANHYIRYNPERTVQRFIPASTFKVFNSLVGLETGVVTDENFVIKWNGTHYPYPEWNRDQTLQSAITNSVVWYYQEVARRVGREQMQHYIDLAGYGNQDITGNIDSFWLDGKLRISQEEQINLLVRLYKNELPFSQRTMDIVKKIMILEKTSTYTLRGKTGFGQRVTPQVGWFIGYVETKGNIYFFAINIESPIPDEHFTQARLTINRYILQALNVLPKN